MSFAVFEGLVAIVAVGMAYASSGPIAALFALAAALAGLFAGIIGTHEKHGI
jgi:hypothetical protein